MSDERVPLGIKLLSAFFAFGAAMYARVVVRLRVAPSEIRVEAFGLPELFVGIVLAVFFGGLVTREALRHPGGETTTPDQILFSSLTFAAIAIGLAVYLSYRGLRPAATFGLGRLAPHKVLGWALVPDSVRPSMAAQSILRPGQATRKS